MKANFLHLESNLGNEILETAAVHYTFCKESFFMQYGDRVQQEERRCVKVSQSESHRQSQPVRPVTASGPGVIRRPAEAA